MTKNNMVANIGNDVLFVTKENSGLYKINTGKLAEVRHYEVTMSSGVTATIKGVITDTGEPLLPGLASSGIANKLIYALSDLAPLTAKVTNINAKITALETDINAL